MAFNNNEPRQEFTATGGQTDFVFNFKIYAETDLNVYLTPVGQIANDTTDILTVVTDYTVVIDGDNGGTVTLTSGATNGDMVTILRDLPYTRTTDYQTGGDLLADTLDVDQDYQTYLAQQLEAKNSRFLFLPESQQGISGLLPTTPMNGYLKLKSDGSGFEYSLLEGSSFQDLIIVDNISDLSIIDTNIFSIAIVKDLDRGGTFIYDSTKVAEDNQGTNFNGWIRQYQAAVNVKWFGAVGDSTTDDTTSINNAIAYVNSLEKVLYFPTTTGNYKITSALSTITTRGGIHFESIAYSAAGKGAILVSGTGYTGVTITGAPNVCNISVVGQGNTANGLLIQNPAIGNFGNIRAHNFDGFGVKINKCWDCKFNTISIEACGNATEYAFSMNDDGDTCNMSHISRLQVENANKKAISISPNTLSCKIDNIHSEGAIADILYNTWEIGGNRTEYGSGRFTATVPANAKMSVSAAVSPINNFLIEGAVNVEAEAYSGSIIDFNSLECQGTFTVKSGQTGDINIENSSLYDLDAIGYGARLSRTKVTNDLSVGFCNNDNTYHTFRQCKINRIVSSDSTSAGVFERCSIAIHNNLLGSATLWNKCTINDGATSDLAIAFKELRLADSIVNANITSDNGTITAINTQFNGNIAQTAGPNSSIFDDKCICTGTTNLGVTAPTTTPVIGTKTYHLVPVTTGNIGWTYTSAGWKAFGTIA